MSAPVDQPDLKPPHDQGYRWPAEWEPHAATWVAWPHNVETWPGKFERIAPQFARFVRRLAQYEPVHVLAGSDPVMREADKLLAGQQHVQLHEVSTNDAWVRDYGPTFLTHPRSGATAMVDWTYNAWGGKYPPWDLDAAVPAQLARQLQCPRFVVELVLEGGAIEGNGRGCVMTTRSCVLNPNRNPGVSAAVVERLLQQYLATDRVVWLDGVPFAGDDTDGHIDQLARFVDATTIVAAVADATDAENHGPLQTQWQQLRQAASAGPGPSFDLVALPLPSPRHFQGERLPASYCNFYIANEAVLVPQFEDAADERAVAILRELFSNHDVIGLPALDLVWGLGAFHCLTQQQPTTPGTLPTPPA